MTNHHTVTTINRQVSKKIYKSRIPVFSQCFVNLFFVVFVEEFLVLYYSSNILYPPSFIFALLWIHLCGSGQWKEASQTLSTAHPVWPPCAYQNQTSCSGKYQVCYSIKIQSFLFLGFFLLEFHLLLIQQSAIKNVSS